MINFSINIVKFIKNMSAFEINYIPEDNGLDTITQTVYVNLLDVENINEGAVHEIFVRNAPVTYWENQLKMRE